ncbi:hypothetical protein Cni_G12399 [Canna indica]|uniref:Uncharacterized protein n=1 Tax=Canna indica TaxID=4628 RepID=A0AAQ3K995_9LILI|nr:hypothetical protein Cni_G12399 [Canna indica]
MVADDKCEAAAAAAASMAEKQVEGGMRLQCNKVKACRFKRSSFGKEGDGMSSAILLLACVVCAPHSIKEKVGEDGGCSA